MDDLKLIAGGALGFDEPAERLVSYLRLAIEDASPKLPNGMATTTLSVLLSGLAGITGDVLSVTDPAKRDVLLYAFEDLIRQRIASGVARGIRAS